MTKKIYIHPEMLVAQLTSMPVMQAASAPDSGDVLGIKIGTTTIQW